VAQSGQVDGGDVPATGLELRDCGGGDRRLAHLIDADQDAVAPLLDIVDDRGDLVTTSDQVGRGDGTVGGEQDRGAHDRAKLQVLLVGIHRVRLGGYGTPTCVVILAHSPNATTYGVPHASHDVRLAQVHPRTEVVRIRSCANIVE